MRLSAQNIIVELAGSVVVDNIDFSVNSGELVMLVGPNGSGKTSLIRTLCAELTPVEGQVLLEDRPVGSWKPIDRAQKMAVLFQQLAVNFPISVEQLVRLGRHPFHDDSKVADGIIDEVLDSMDLTSMAQRSVLSLSGGEQQRAQIARVLAQIWRAGSQVDGEMDGELNGVLILDEPLASLDIVYQYQLLELLQKLVKNGLSIVLSIHDLNLASLFADRMVLLDKGQVVAAGTSVEVFTQDNIKQVFNQSVDMIEHPGSGRPQMMYSSRT